ncbi:MAG: HRDC domain-containing protein [Arachnia propionica]|uniref:ribonuclease D n=1 Tax=Arachnia propionica TaxID=1750 RepID=UPI0026FAE709|nr:HRDC domain-containing protein [Arachnia propionica]
MTDFTESLREPLRPVVASEAALRHCLASLRDGHGPVAFDAERAHGHRYWPKAYLFQLRREGSGTWLIDPVALEVTQRADLSPLVEATGSAEWLIHAAPQDLPCMTEVGIQPPLLFDTELAARLLGEPHVSLAALLEAKLGVRLRKAHSSADWSRRPLPDSWLRYAALDVEHLVELTAVLREELVGAGRMTWAEQEFAHLLTVVPTPRSEPWRRLSGIQVLRRPRQLAVARALWEARDAIARDRDRPPGRILSDQAIIDLASRVDRDAPLPDASMMLSIPGFQHRGATRYRTNWLSALAHVERLSDADLPTQRPQRDGVGHPRSWERSFPEAWRRWKPIRAAVDELAGSLGIQPSLLAPPAVLQTFVHSWDGTPVGPGLTALGARPWQVDLLTPVLEPLLQSS